MEFRILGPLEALSGGESIDLGPHKQRAVLAVLLLNVGRVVPTDRILEELWGDDAASREKALWVHISRLRSALEPKRAERGQSSLLATRDHGYMIRAGPTSVDAHRFEAAVGEAGARLIDDPEAAAEILRLALGLWRGSALQDFAYDEFARAEIARLEEMRIGAVEMRIDADLRRGLAAEMIGELAALVEQQPQRERPVAQLMHACYRAGRQAEGLRAFQCFRRRIGEELGIEPSPELCRLEEQILLHDPRLARWPAGQRRRRRIRSRGRGRSMRPTSRTPSVVDHTITVTFDDSTRRADGLAPYKVGEVARIEVVNNTRRDAVFRIDHDDMGTIDIIAPAGGTSMGYAWMLPSGHYTAHFAPKSTIAAVQTWGSEVGHTVCPIRLAKGVRTRRSGQSGESRLDRS